MLQTQCRDFLIESKEENACSNFSIGTNGPAGPYCQAEHSLVHSSFQPASSDIILFTRAFGVYIILPASRLEKINPNCPNFLIRNQFRTTISQKHYGLP
jgi:hypothetical protein